jgi:hypothetical protein
VMTTSPKWGGASEVHRSRIPPKGLFIPRFAWGGFSSPHGGMLRFPGGGLSARSVMRRAVECVCVLSCLLFIFAAQALLEWGQHAIGGERLLEQRSTSLGQYTLTCAPDHALHPMLL